MEVWEILYEYAVLGNAGKNTESEIIGILEKIESFDRDGVLKFAAIKNFTKMAEFALSKGADPNYSPDGCKLPLEYALRNKNIDMVATLIKFGARISDKISNMILDMYGDSPSEEELATFMSIVGVHNR